MDLEIFNIIILILILTLVGSLGGYCFKKAASNSESILKVILKPTFYIGGILYIIGSILNIIVLKKLPYTKVFPLTSITYIWTLIISYIALKERITINKVLGVVLIIVGAIFVAIKG